MPLNSVLIEADRAYTSLDDVLQGKRNVLGISDYETIVEHLDEISHVSPQLEPFGRFGANVRHAGQSTFTEVSAVTAAYEFANQMIPGQGRFLSATDDVSRRRVCFIGSKVLEKLETGR